MDVLHTLYVHFENPSINSPASALRITLNDGEGSYFGEKYKVEKVRANFPTPVDLELILFFVLIACAPERTC